MNLSLQRLFQSYEHIVGFWESLIGLWPVDAISRIRGVRWGRNGQELLVEWEYSRNDDGNKETLALWHVYHSTKQYNR